MFTGYNLQEFILEFNSEEKCKKYLYDIKWALGFACVRCGHKGHCNTVRFGELKCNKCKHKHSVTSGTLFHHLKFDIVKAFLMVFLVSTDKKGVSSLELHRRTGIRAKTCYYFKRKIMKAMHQGNFKLRGRVDVDESSIGGKEPGKRGRSKGKKKEFVIGIQMFKKRIVGAFAHQIKNASSKELKPFFDQRVSTNANVRVDKWRAYNPIKRNYPNMVQEKSKPEQNFKLLHREIMMLKAALRGIYQHITHLQDYLNEYFFRKNIHDKSQLFHTVISNMILSKPISINQLNLG